MLPLALFAASLLRFSPETLATGLKGGYQTVAVDMNRDGRPDLLVVASGMTDLLWLENPGAPGQPWPRHIIASNLSRMINVWPLDVDGDKIPELLLASEFSNEASKSAGLVSYLHFDGAAWQIREVDRLPTSHRLRAAGGLFINAPLTGAAALPPDYRAPTPLVAYRPGDFNRQLISSEENGLVHGIYIHDWNRDGRDDILSASFSGIFVHLAQPNQTWKRQRLAAGSPAAWPRSGASDIAIGHLGRRNRFLAAIEPWHGNLLTVYTGARLEHRTVIDDSLNDGHTLHTADFDGDGRDEILAGFRQGARGVYLYREQKGRWVRQVISEGEVAAAGCAIADFNADRKPDIACIGSSTANLILWTQQ